MIIGRQFYKNLERFRLVTFDITDTLLCFSKSPAVQYAETAASMGVENIDENKLNECFRREFKMMSKKYPNFGYQAPDMNWQQWWIKLVENIFNCVKPEIQPKILTEIAEKLLHQYRTRECWLHVDGGLEMVEMMKIAGKYVGVISNFDPSLTEVLNEMNMAEKFDFILTSYDSGTQKPEAAIFKIPLKQCNVKPHEALHIGNMFDIDYIGARNSGWSSLLVSKEIHKYPIVNESHAYKSIPEMTNALQTKDIKW